MKKWYSLIDKVYRMENLEKAYKAVKANNGAPGVDGVTVEAYGLNLQEELNKLHHQLKTGSYEPDPARLPSIKLWIQTRPFLSSGGCQSGNVHKQVWFKPCSRYGLIQML